MWRRIKAMVYRRGYRPKYGNPFYSSSLSWIYGYHDAILKDKRK